MFYDYIADFSCQSKPCQWEWHLQAIQSRLDEAVAVRNDDVLLSACSSNWRCRHLIQITALSLLYYLLLLTLTSSLTSIFWTHLILESGSHSHKSCPFHLWVTEYLTVDSTATLAMASASRTNGHILVLVYGTGRNKRPDSGVCRPL